MQVSRTPCAGVWAERCGCLASEKRSGGKSRGWGWADRLGLWGFGGLSALVPTARGRFVVAREGKPVMGSG